MRVPLTEVERLSVDERDSAMRSDGGAMCVREQIPATWRARGGARWRTLLQTGICAVTLATPGTISAQPSERIDPPESDSLALALVRRGAQRDGSRPLAWRGTAEIAVRVVEQRADGRRHLISQQQVAGTVSWRSERGVHVEIHGYRSVQTGLSSALPRALRQGWIVPELWSDVLVLRHTAAAPLEEYGEPLGSVLRVARWLLPTPETTAVLHPLAPGAPTEYRYSLLGLSVDTLDDGQAIPVHRIRVAPRPTARRGGRLDGVLHLDTTTGALVRLRGRVERSGPRAWREQIAYGTDGITIGYVDLATDPAHDFRIPATQRVEFLQGVLAAGQPATSVQVVTRLAVDSITDACAPGDARTACHDAPRRRYTGRYGGGDSLRQYDDWSAPLGADVRAPLDGQRDVLPASQLTTGRPVIGYSSGISTDLFRFNRVEGPFTGLGTTIRFRDAAPGVLARATLGYAWAERTARGRVTVLHARGARIRGVGAGRLLDLTNDFRSPFDSGTVWSPLFVSTDQYDYVDRRYARVLAREPLRDGRIIVHAEAGWVEDRAVQTSLSRGLLGGPFLPNRGVENGTAVRTMVAIEWEPDVWAELAEARVGGQLRYERGDGMLAWQRAEGTFVMRAPLTVRGQDVQTQLLVHGGALLGGAVPPQQLFEFGAQQHLPGYAYKQFAGDRAAAIRGTVAWPMPLLSRPVRLVPGFYLPALSPALTFGAQMAWAEASSPAARSAIGRLGPVLHASTGSALADNNGAFVPVARPSDGVRATVSLGVRLLGGAIYAGVARPVDRRADAPRGFVAVFGFGGVL